MDETDVAGRRPLVAGITRSYLEYMDWDIRLGVEDEGRPVLGDLIQAHDIAGDGPVYRDENIVVTAAEVPHGAAAEAVGYTSVGIENDPKYFDIASRAIPQLMSYGRMSAEGVLVGSSSPGVS